MSTTPPQHTPWTARQEGEHWIMRDGEGHIILSIHTGWIPMEEHLPLILAAPELLEALIIIQHVLATAVPIDYKRDCSTALEIANAAIAKAKGEPR